MQPEKKDILPVEEQRMTGKEARKQCNNILKVLREEQNQLHPVKSSAKMKAKMTFSDRQKLRKSIVSRSAI